MFLNEFIDEGMASWTTDKTFAKSFKSKLREGTFAAVFVHVPQSNEVLLNVPELWRWSTFKEAIKTYHACGGLHAEALIHSNSHQNEVIMNADLKLSDLTYICGKISSLEILCQELGAVTEEEQDLLWKGFVNAGQLPEELT